MQAKRYTSKLQYNLVLRAPRLELYPVHVER
jgi:hypothetical protein